MKLHSSPVCDGKAEPPSLKYAGNQWRGEELFAIKTWFAESFATKAFSVALLRLGSEPRLAKVGFAEQAVLEWYKDRFDRMTQNYNPSSGSFPALALSDLGKYVTGTFARKLRKQWAREQPEFQENAETGEMQSIFDQTTGEDGRESLEWSDLLQELVARLSEPDRELLTLVSHGYTRTEIADQFGISPGNVRIQIFRARARAREIWKEIQS